VADAVAWIGVTGGVAGGVAALYTATRAKSIEKYRAGLKSEGYEHEVRFARLHERRVDVVAEMYGRLVRAEEAITAYVHPLELAGGPSKDELSVPAQESYDAFVSHFKENRIWFDRDLEAQVDDYMARLHQAGISFTLYRRHEGRRLEESYFEKWGEAWNVVDKETPPLRRAIEGRMREMLGVVDADDG
jgi:hypothetical protein